MKRGDFSCKIESENRTMIIFGDEVSWKLIRKFYVR